MKKMTLAYLSALGIIAMLSIASYVTLIKSISSQKGKFTQGHLTDVTASIGIALFPFDSNETHSLLACTDQAMCLAKGQGRNCFCFIRAVHKTAHHKPQ